MKILLMSLLASAICLGPMSRALAAEDDLTKLSLEDLLSTEVTSVAKTPQRVDEAAAAVFVISQDDIRRSGMSTIPDLLRMVPGLEVGDLPSGGAAVAARGFNGYSSNKLLVLIDGRAIYLSALSGVFWDQQLIPVEDIQRIEVVRGPGATLWGANAVNGVINVVTKHSVDTLGAAASAQVDSTGSSNLDVRYGAQLGSLGALRVYVTRRQQDGRAQLLDTQFDSDSDAVQGGFRADIEPSDIDALTLQGDIQSGNSHFPPAYAFARNLPLPTAIVFNGANLLGRWNRTWDARTGMSVQANWDVVRRSGSGLKGRADQFNLDLSGHFSVGDRNAFVVGAGIRRTSDLVTGSPVLFLSPDNSDNLWYGAYVEDDISLVRDRLDLTVGTKVEHNDYSGVEIQPSIRAIWHSPAGWSAWGAISRATRTPSRFETAITLMTPQLEVLPGPLKSEQLTAYEMGWRSRLWSGATLDLTVFHQVYDKLIAQRQAGAPALTGPQILGFGNVGRGRNDGVGAALNVQIKPWWAIKAAASWQSLSIDNDSAAEDFPGSAVNAGASPRAQVSVRSQWNVTDAVDFDAWIRHVGRLQEGPVKAYNDLDLRLAWRPTAHLEVSLAGFNLLKSQRIEFIDPALPFKAVIERRGQVGLAVRY